MAGWRLRTQGRFPQAGRTAKNLKAPAKIKENKPLIIRRLDESPLMKHDLFEKPRKFILRTKH
jgi:hypothetical protein